MIAVVGGRGFIGGAIVKALRRDGQEVVVVTHAREAAASDSLRYGDMTDPATLPAALDGAQVVVQSANFPSYPVEKRRAGHSFEATDGRGTEHLLEAARRVGARRYLFISGVGTRPGSGRPYFEALWQGEEGVRQAGLEHFILRPSFVYGPRDRGLNTILTFARRSPVIPFLAAGQQHQPVFIDDLAELARRGAELGAPQGTYELGGPERLGLVEMIRRALEAAGLGRRAFLPVPRPLARFGAALLEPLPGPLLTRSAVDFLCESFLADNQPAVEAFGLALTPLAEGLRRYLPSGDTRRPRSAAGEPPPP